MMMMMMMLTWTKKLQKNEGTKVHEHVGLGAVFWVWNPPKNLIFGGSQNEAKSNQNGFYVSRGLRNWSPLMKQRPGRSRTTPRRLFCV